MSYASRKYYQQQQQERLGLVPEEDEGEEERGGGGDQTSRKSSLSSQDSHLLTGDAWVRYSNKDFPFGSDTYKIDHNNFISFLYMYSFNILYYCYLS